MKLINKFDPEGKLNKRILSALVLAPIAIGILVLGGVLFKLAVVLLTGAMLYEFYNMVLGIKPSESEKIKFALLAVAFILIPMSILSKLRTTLPDGLIVTSWLLASVWASDIAAYFVGLKFRGPKLAPTISPSKTWSGFFGACAATIVIGYIFEMSFGHESIHYSSAGILLGAIAQCGDLFESNLKRKFGVKDSGNLIPGHGGLLDRTDSLLSSLYYVLLILIIT